ncbi:diacylglycerol acyltransferase, partial [Cooperia oncophora]
MLRREWLLLSGFIDCSKESIQNALTMKKAGQAVVVALDNRRGFPMVFKISELGFKNLIGISVPFFYGRGLFQLNFGFLPYRRPINTVIGAPIDVPKILEPTDEEVDRLHRQYCDALIDLFEQHKT